MRNCVCITLFACNLLSAMTDITPLFKATVKAVKARLKAQGEVSASDKSILGTSKQKSEFSVKAKDVVCDEYVCS